MPADKKENLIKRVKEGYETDAHAGKLSFKNSFYLERGPYDIISVLDENSDSSAYRVKGPVIDLFDPLLPVLNEKSVIPGEQSFLVDLSRIADKKRPQVLASASRIYEELGKKNSYSFICKSPVRTLNSMRILLPAKPVLLKVTDNNAQPLTDVKSNWDGFSHTLWLSFENSPQGIYVKLGW